MKFRWTGPVTAYSSLKGEWQFHPSGDPQEIDVASDEFFQDAVANGLLVPTDPDPAAAPPPLPASPKVAAPKTETLPEKGA